MRKYLTLKNVMIALAVLIAGPPLATFIISAFIYVIF